MSAPPDLLLGRVLEEWYCIVPLPDPGSRFREKADQQLKARGCTVFRELRQYDAKSESDIVYITGYKVEQNYSEKLSRRDPSQDY